MKISGERFRERERGSGRKREKDAVLGEKRIRERIKERERQELMEKLER